ncbi:MAG: multiheme c-type cytochrome, partial [Candidatus Sumerlaeota bacterium]|nr:multiheme c-type cytochrome [Candidatus Sumerlaeota bacterium]
MPNAKISRRVIYISVLAAAAILTVALWAFLKTESGSGLARFFGLPGAPGGFVGSSECRACHENFYRKWAPSWHGLAMQTYAGAMVRAPISRATTDVMIGQYQFRPEITSATGYVQETGPHGKKRYAMLYTLGGKNVYYFLTPVERGRLQVLPIAFDMRRRQWLDTTASALRHFRESPDEALHWTERPLTFNTSCHGCHVSQISSNYDLEKDTYHTVWREPGINCETCHGPGGEHIRVCKRAPKDRPPSNLKIISTKKFSADQNNALCAPCHAKMIPLTGAYKPGDRYLDHYDLVCLEDRDFYPDGRDLG